MSVEDVVRVSRRTLLRLKELAEWSGVSVEEALTEAIKRQHRDRFYAIVNEQYAALRADPEAWKEIEEERRLWDVTLMDGLRDEPPYPPREEPAS